MAALPVAALERPGKTRQIVSDHGGVVQLATFRRHRVGFRGYYSNDPYGYEYVQPDYYPYYDSGQWHPAWAYRRPHYDYELPPYGEAWGYPSYDYAPRRSHRSRRDHSRHQYHDRGRRRHW